LAPIMADNSKESLEEPKPNEVCALGYGSSGSSFISKNKKRLCN